MKKSIILMLVVVMSLSMSVFVSASTVEEKTVNTSESDNKSKGEGIISLFENYYTEGLIEYEELKAEHYLFHETQEIKREELKDLREISILDFKDKFQVIKMALNLGELTRKEAFVQISELKAEGEEKRIIAKAINAEIQTILEAKTLEVNEIKDLMVENRLIIQTEIANDPVDEIAIADALAIHLDLLRQHITIDYKYAVQIDSLLDN